MKKRLLSLTMAGIMVVTMSSGAFAVRGGVVNIIPGKSRPPVGNMQPRPEVTSAGGVYIPPIDNGEGVIIQPPIDNTSGSGVVLPRVGNTTELKALQNQLAALGKQLQKEIAKLKQATPRNKKAIENNIKTIMKKIDTVKAKINAINKLLNNNDNKIRETQKAYIDSIEAIVKKDRSNPILVTVDKITTDNPAVKADLPLMVRNGVVYMAQSTLESSFGIQIKYMDNEKKFVTKIEGSLVEIFLAKDLIEIDGTPKQTEAKPYPIKKDIYFPVNLIDKLLKIEVKWDKASGTITVDDLDVANLTAPVGQ